MSTPKIRSNHDKVERFLYNIPHEKLDISLDEETKTLWKKKNGGNTELPMLLINGIRPGSIEDLEEAAEYRELRQYLKLDEVERPQEKSLDEIEVTLQGLSEEDANKLAAELDEIDLKKSAKTSLSGNDQDSSKPIETSLESSSNAEVASKSVASESTPTLTQDSKLEQQAAVEPETESIKESDTLEPKSGESHETT